jgi:hypothetical protein
MDSAIFDSRSWRYEAEAAAATGQLVHGKPDRFLVRYGLVQETQDQRVNPQTDEWPEGLTHVWA